MTEKHYPLNLDKNYSVALANELLLGRQKTMSIWANRILNFLVMQLVGDETMNDNFKTHTVRVKDLADFIGYKSKDVYDEIVSAIKEIMDTTVEIGDRKDKNKPWKLFHWMSLAEYDGKSDGGNATLKLSLSEEVKPYLFELKKRGFFTQYQIKEILPMNSFYAIRLYQYITYYYNLNSKNVDFIKMSIKDLREYLECVNTFQRISDLKKCVIEIAVKQINNNPNSEFWIETEYIKTGRPVTHVIFHVHYGKFMRDVADIKGGGVGEQDN